MDIKANNPNLKSWIEVKPESDFPMQNLPFGVYKDAKAENNACVAIGEYIVDLQRTHELGYFNNISLPVNVFAKQFLNDFIVHRVGEPGRFFSPISLIHFIQPRF